MTDSGSTTPPEGTQPGPFPTGAAELPGGGADFNHPESERPAPRESLIVTRAEAEQGHSAGRRPKPARRETSGDCLARALRAKQSGERRALAEAGLVRLDQEGDDDPEMEALLLRQIYLADLEDGDLEGALQAATEMVELEALGDIARQDAARAAAALGEIDVAAAHLRIAAEVCPPDRRAFHLATLGSLLRFAGRATEAVPVFQTAVDCAKKDRFLYLGQWALAEQAAGQEPTWALEELRRGLESAPTQKGYALWVLGELCAALGDEQSGARYLTRFLGRVEGAPRAKALALAGEVAHAKTLLARR